MFWLYNFRYSFNVTHTISKPAERNARIKSSIVNTLVYKLNVVT